VLTAGIDLAAESAGTALAVIEWADGGARLVDLRLGVDDAAIVAVASAGDVAKLGIDCAFGWPDEFVAFVSGHADPSVTDPSVHGGMAWRRTLAYRETDRFAHKSTGRWPLSVSTDRLGLTAMRCAGLLRRLTEAGVDTDRAGAGYIAEVYPGASLRLWGFDTMGYRRAPERRRELLAVLRARAPWFDLAETHVELMVASGGAFDAVVAALVTRAAAQDRYIRPPADVAERATREGWIALPTGEFETLIDSSPDA
jgi:hypothetical protein